MKRKAGSGRAVWRDPDDAPELDGAFFDRATIRQGNTVIRRGRPRKENTKEQVTLRLDRDILATFKKDGAGWQSRINDALRSVLPRKRLGQ